MSIQNLVRISTGESNEYFVTDSGSVYPISSLTKSGVPNANHTHIGWMVKDEHNITFRIFAPYNAEREPAAAYIRQLIRDLNAQIVALETSLITLYRQKEQQP